MEKIDAAVVQMLRSMADALDTVGSTGQPYNSQMWREYREAIRGLTAGDSDTDLAELLADLRSPVRDPEKA